MPKITLCITDAGGGHRASAEAIIAHFKDDPAYSFRIVNIYTEVFKSNDEDIYNGFILKKGCGIIYWPILVPLFRLKIFLFRNYYKNKLKLFWRNNSCDQVISLLPFLNDILLDSVKETIRTPFKISCTDFDEPCNNYWLINRKVSAYFFPTTQLRQRLGANNTSPIIENRGVILKPDFYQDVDFILDHNFNKNLPIGLLIMGGYGSSDVLDYLLAANDESYQFIVICGHNERLLHKIKSHKWRSTIFATGFSRNVAGLMRHATYFIGKPGPGSVQEALSQNLPTLVLYNKSTMKQEASVAEYIIKNKVGLYFSNKYDFVAQLNLLLSQYDALKKAIENLKIESPHQNLKDFLLIK